MMLTDRPALTAEQFNAVIDRYLTSVCDEIPNALFTDLTLWTVLADLLTHAGVDRADWHPAVQACDELTLWMPPTPAA
ncbi:MAG: hypothetical protein M3O23_13160 [Actinomycetota bacterium]|nr:hypothetical protein [Actinomycetota bacterium]